MVDGRYSEFFSMIDKTAILKAVQDAERACAVEFKVAVAHSRQGDLHRLAASIAEKLGVSKTVNEPGLLVLILPARREFVLWGNAKVNRILSQNEWCAARDAAIPLLAQGQRADAVRVILKSLVKTLARAFPPGLRQSNELPDKPVEIK